MCLKENFENLTGKKDQKIQINFKISINLHCFPLSWNVDLPQKGIWHGVTMTYGTYLRTPALLKHYYKDIGKWKGRTQQQTSCQGP